MQETNDRDPESNEPTPAGDDAPLSASSGLAGAESAARNGAGEGNGLLNGAARVGSVRNVSIDTEMRTAYLDYAMSVIVARALPDARDGLKPVHRRILYAMHDMGLTHDKPHKKSARIVGEVLGKYHPHGDTAVYDAMARMAQPFSLRYPLVDGQGNFGSVDGDSPAAMRYTEARLAGIAAPMLQDIDMETVEWQPNFDDSLEEPQVLPGMLPNFLVNGTSGIAVGMATNVPPHNLREVADAITFVVDHWQRRDEIGLDELMQFVKGPDFPTGGIILGSEGITQALGSGHGKIIVRARTTIEEGKNGRFRIMVSEIPYQVNKSSLIERIAELVRDKRIDGISDLRDESDRKGMRIIIELSKSAQPRQVLNRLFKHTALQTSFSVNTLALVRGEPATLSLRRAIIVYIEHRTEVITRRTEYQLAKARERAHILEGLRIALQFLDEVIRTIRESESAESARSALMERFGLTQVQAQAILDLQLRRLASLERQKIEDEYNEIVAKIAWYEELLANPDKVRGLVREDIAFLREKYGDDRRTEISRDSGELGDDELIGQDNVLVVYSAGSYIKRMMAREFPTQSRGGRGRNGASLREGDEVSDLVFARTLDHILFFTDKGRCYTSRVHQLPVGSRTARGMPIVNVLNLQPDEKVTAMVVAPDFNAAQYITLATRQAKIKRMELSVFANVRATGIIAMTLDDGDSLDWARLTQGSNDFIMTTRGGKALRFRESDVRPMGRGAMGVMALRLLGDDTVVSLDVVREGCDLLVILERGWGKRVALDEFTPHGRYSQGMWATDHTKLEETGRIVAAHVVHPEDEVTIISSGGTLMRTAVGKINRYGRMTRGVRVVNWKDEATVAAIAVIDHEDMKRAAEGTQGAVKTDEEFGDVVVESAADALPAAGFERALDGAGDGSPDILAD